MPCRSKSTTTVKKRMNNNPVRNKKASNPKKSSTRKNEHIKSSPDTKENRFITDYFSTVSRRKLAIQSKLEEYNKQIEYCLENCTDPKENLVVADIEFKGKGIVASHPIKKGCFICEYSGDLIDIEEANVILI